MSQDEVLGLIVMRPGINQDEIKLRCKHVSDILKHLRLKGYVEREQDGRTWKYTATQAGRDEIAKAEALG